MGRSIAFGFRTTASRMTKFTRDGSYAFENKQDEFSLSKEFRCR